uniref:Uncharacterized protein n=1 Tax=Favella ehrenbergii TaxID=182087 RepID=A0A7S3I1W7_9SPIT|mmetsp:Transcript_28574/g.35359  ORF Transcript_28574/g.35359 Transcript_28574/m.35359 type:complete len:126 (+) Transcript_28574:568-945(+)
MDARAAKITDSEATRRYLEEGNFFFAKDAAKMGLIDQIVSPDAFFQEHFKGELYTIGELKSSIWEKLGLINREEYLASILDSLADEHLQAAEDALQSSTQMLEADPLTFAMQQGLLSPHLTRDFP